MKEQELYERLTRAEYRFRIFGGVGLAAVAMMILFSSLPRAVAQQTGGLPALANRVKTLEQKVAAQQTIINQHTAQIAALQTKLTQESAARRAADAQLQANINAEAAARIAADNRLLDEIDDEAADRIAADARLQSQITAEATARAAKDAELAQRIRLLEARFP